MKKLFIAVSAILIPVYLVGCSKEANDSMTAVYDDVINKRYDEALCASGKIYKDMSEESRLRFAHTSRAAMRQIASTEWAREDDNMKYVRIANEMFAAKNAGDQARIEAMSGSLRELC